MSGKGAVLRVQPSPPDYELDTSKNYQLVFVKHTEYENEFEALELFQERMNDAIHHDYFPLGSPTCLLGKDSEYYIFQGILKRNK